MPMPPGFEWVAALPPGFQVLVMLGVGIGLAIWGRGGFLTGKKEPAVSTKGVILTAGSITDMSPVRDLVAAVTRLAVANERCADELGTIRQILAEDSENRQDDRTYRRGLEAGRREPTPRRRT